MVIGPYAALPWVLLVVGGPFMPRSRRCARRDQGLCSRSGVNCAGAAAVPTVRHHARMVSLEPDPGVRVAFQWIGADTWINTVVSSGLAAAYWHFRDHLGAHRRLRTAPAWTHWGRRGTTIPDCRLLASDCHRADDRRADGSLLDGSGVWRLDLAPVLLLPTATAGALVSGFVDSTVFALLPLYGLELARPGDDGGDADGDICRQLAAIIAARVAFRPF